MGFFLFDFKRHDEAKKLRKLVGETVQELSVWIRDYPNDGTPPTEDECATLTAEKMKQLTAEFEAKAAAVITSRGVLKEDLPKRRQQLKKEMARKEKKLFARFSAHVDALEQEAQAVLEHCLALLKEEIEETTSELPTSPDRITSELDEWKATAVAYIEANYPEGVEGLNAYDDDLPEGVPSWQELETTIFEEERNKLLELNQEAIPGALEALRTGLEARLKEQVNMAITKTMNEIVTDLSDDVLPYVDNEETMQELRDELIAKTKEYCEGRLAE